MGDLKTSVMGLIATLLATDGTDFYALLCDALGHLQADVLSSALPSGAATAARQDTMITALQLIDDLRAALASVAGDQLRADVISSALPTGAATAARQDTMITALQLIDDLRAALGSVNTDDLQVDVKTSALPDGAATAARQDTMITALQLIDDLRAALASVATDKIRVTHPDIQLDDTDKPAVSLYGKYVTAGDVAIKLLSWGGLYATLWDSGGNVIQALQPAFDAWNIATNYMLQTTAVPELYDPYNDRFDRQRNNDDRVIMAAANRTASTNSAVQTNYNHRGVLVHLDVDTVPGGGETLIPVIRAWYPSQGHARVLLTGSVITVAGRYAYMVYPGIGAAAEEITAVSSFALPRLWQVRIVHSASGTWNYNVEASLIV